MRRLAAPLRQVDRTCVLHRGRRLAYFAGCDYFRLAHHPGVIAAAKRALDQFGFGAAASRLTTGNHPLFLALERRLARFFHAERALLVTAGYAADPVVTQALADQTTHALIDGRAHASLREAAALLACPVLAFAHRDAADLRRALARVGPEAKPLVLTDGLFAHDGSMAPLAEYLQVLPRRGRLLVDDAHGVGVLGRTGRGTLEACGVADRRVILAGTLSKAFGASGGFVAGDAGVIATIISRSRWFGASTPLPFPSAAAALAAIEILSRNRARSRRLRSHVARLKSAARAAGLDIPDNEAPILAVVPRDAAEVRRFERSLKRHGVFPSLIRYPGGPDAGYFRFAVSSEHTAGQVARLAAALQELGGGRAGRPRRATGSRPS